jgi:hypothetical protein
VVSSSFLASFFDGLFGVFARFGAVLHPFWDSRSVLFSNWAWKPRPHEYAVPADQIKGRALRKTTKKRPRSEGKNGMRPRTRKWGPFWNHFGSLWGPFWEPRGHQKTSEMLDVFLNALEGPFCVLWVSLGCLGPPPPGLIRRHARRGLALW